MAPVYLLRIFARSIWRPQPLTQSEYCHEHQINHFLYDFHELTSLQLMHFVGRLRGLYFSLNETSDLSISVSKRAIFRR